MTLATPAAEGIYRDEFPIFRHSVYLNSCSLGALSLRARARVNEFLDLWERRGASAWYDVWWAALADLRVRYGRVIGAAEGTIALHPNVSSALSVVGESLDYRRRPKVIVTSLDFPTIGYQWLAKGDRGVEVEILESPDGIRVPLELYERAIDDRTALVATSHVFFTTGAIQDIAAIAGLAHRKGALCLIDGYQGAGQLPVDVRANGVDFYCSGGLKWLMGGTGIAFLYAAPAVTQDLHPQVTGWFAHRDQFRFDPRELELHDDARRLEMGTPALMPVYAQRGGLEILEELGTEAIRRRTAELTEDLVELAEARGLRPHVAPTAAERSGIVMLPSDDPHREVAMLAAAGFVTDARPRHVRVSPYFYNVPDDHRALIEQLTRGR
ncbi:MAG TPA: aminotransferase class V-fold PLP-dependent enzyme [Gemmatimonadales bacterium]|nr:aminotransferase class V-fold PLP-dependent enzyme [Gemmatimonadales bacterium]